ncbi:unnamed protein product [Plutella xylostella]|uniref:(diamondback moth) hypothetical protein n=1 Tax=Plutella xylostella TaxID=51655 RepID=A0A8S4FS86_PLUXY|nr:unnamed protein product [Plutella xylostella]
MLQQILRDLWVDPEILAELDDAQKQTLFCKMREEQVRRWQQWDQKVSQGEEPRRLKTSKKQVQFLKGEDGEPWVWVMGEHPDDKSIETLLAEEAKRKAVEQARHEAHQLRKSVEKELTHLIDDYKPLDSLEQKFDLSPKSVDSIEDTLEIYCSVDELRQRIQALEPEVKLPDSSPDSLDDKNEYRNEKNLKMEVNKNTLHFNFIEGKRDAYQELGIPSGGDGVSLRVAAWERRVAAARAGDILRGLRARRARTLRDAQLHEHDADVAWREQERKAKEAEAAMREIARAAREEHRRSSVMEPPVDPCLTEAGKPPNREAVIEWFRNYELKRGVGLDENKKPMNWFHGLITRSESEALLATQPAGRFLVRVSERVWGYAVSLRGAGGTGGAGAAGGRCKHFLVEAVGANYRLLGAQQRLHASLADLIKYHKTVPITEAGGELLTTPCVPAQTPAILTPPS